MGKGKTTKKLSVVRYLIWGFLLVIPGIQIYISESLNLSRNLTAPVNVVFSGFVYVILVGVKSYISNAKILDEKLHSKCLEIVFAYFLGMSFLRSGFGMLVGDALALEIGGALLVVYYIFVIQLQEDVFKN